MPLQGHATDKARTVLPGQLHPKGEKQQQVRQKGRPAHCTQAAEELREVEAADGPLDRIGNGAVKPAIGQRNRAESSENLALSSDLAKPVL